MDIHKGAARMSAHRDTYNGKDSIKIIGPFDSISDLLIEHVKDIAGEGKSEIVLDLSEATYMTSQGIACIIKMVKNVPAGSCMFEIANANKDMIELIRLAHIDKYITFIQ